jgi:uncharacterized membrane protein
MTVHIKRHIAKAMSYRLLGSLQTIIIGYILTGNVYISSAVGLIELIIKPVIYFIHERVWYKYIPYGIEHNNKQRGLPS